jgi:monofunctional glycosyltransferase
VARDIAFVADKDTRDNLGAYSDLIPIADVPPSEGGPVTRDPSTDSRTAEKPDAAPSAPTGPALPANPKRGDALQRTEPSLNDAEATDAPDLAGATTETFELDPDPESGPEPQFVRSDAEPKSELAPAADPQTREPAEPVEPRQPDHEAASPAIVEPPEEAPSTPTPADPTAPEAAATPRAATSDGHGTWRTAIADALFEPSPSFDQDVAHTEPTPNAEPSPPIEPAAEPPASRGDPPPAAADQDRQDASRAHARSAIELLPERAAPPRWETPAPPHNRDEARPAPPVEPERAPPVSEPAGEPVSARSDDGFTAAAEDLFRPPELDRDPHLITIGRRLDPALRIPRPVPPVIAPRYEPDPDPDIRPTWKTGSWRDRLWIAGRYAAFAAGGYLALVLVLIVLFRFVNPPGSMLMLTKLLTGNSVDRIWVPLDQMSPNLVRAVIVSEDGRFCEHSGIDTLAMRDAIEKASGGIARGASTISMQVTKNLFLWNAKSYVRKVIEIPLTLVMEILWPKRRILEVYLNIAEWGPGVFGAEAAARHHFNKPAYRLNEREAALLAAVLPNPVRRDAGSPNTLTSSKARVVQARVRAYGAIAGCVVGSQSRAAGTREPPAAVLGNATATPRNQPARKTQPQRRAPRRETIEDWGATVRMGPQ